MNYFSNQKFWLVIFTAFIGIIPFFWLNPGEMDLGGDSSRLYFYDPYSYLMSAVLYANQPYGFRPEESYIMYLPFVLFIYFLKLLLGSSWLIITLFNSFKLIVAFLSIFGILYEFLKKNTVGRNYLFFSAVMTGFMYIFFPVMQRASWDKAIMSQNQFFLNPLLFYLLLQYIHSKNIAYILLALIITVVFSGNFSWGGAPTFFAYYPIVILFLFLYGKFIKNIQLNYKQIFLSFILGIGMHAFHIAPLVIQFVNKTGTAFTKTFTSAGQADSGLSYFMSTAVHITATKSWIGLPQLAPSTVSFDFIFLVIPVLLIVGYYLNAKKEIVNKVHKKAFLLIFFFFLISYFFVTANITNSGFELYKSFFAIPGFTMFRNYYGQWMYLYTFFMVILIGWSLYYLFLHFRNTYINSLIAFILLLIFSIGSFSFIRGDMINIILNPESNNKYKVPIIFDKKYENFLSFVRNEKTDTKIISFPFTESFYQMIAGTQHGMYQGPSTISYLGNKADFTGYQVVSPFSEVMLETVKQKDYSSFLTLLSIMNIKNIYYNSDPAILNYFQFFPYQHVKDYFPKSHEEYKKFLEELPLYKTAMFGENYHYYSLDEKYVLPHIYVAKEVIRYDHIEDEWGQLKNPFYSSHSGEIRKAFIPNSIRVDKTIENIPQIAFEKKNPTKYYIKVKNVTGPYLLIFSDNFSQNWQLFRNNNNNKEFKIVQSYFNKDIIEGQHTNSWFYQEMFETLGKQEIAQKDHFLTNGYANGWYINPRDFNGESEYTITLEMVSQRYIYIGIIISTLSFIICLFWITMLRFGKQYGKKK